MSNSQGHADQSVGERALREYKRRADLDSRLGDAARDSAVAEIQRRMDRRMAVL